MIEICPKCLSEDIHLIKNSLDEYLCNECGWMGTKLYKTYMHPREWAPFSWFPPSFTSIPAPITKLATQSERSAVENLVKSLSIIKEEPVVTLGTMKRVGNRVANKNSIEIPIVRRF